VGPSLHRNLEFHEPEVIHLTLQRYREFPSLGFLDCLLLELAHYYGHTPLGTFRPQVVPTTGRSQALNQLRQERYPVGDAIREDVLARSMGAVADCSHAVERRDSERAPVKLPSEPPPNPVSPRSTPRVVAIIRAEGRIRWVR